MFISYSFKYNEIGGNLIKYSTWSSLNRLIFFQPLPSQHISNLWKITIQDNISDNIRSFIKTKYIKIDDFDDENYGKGDYSVSQDDDDFCLFKTMAPLANKMHKI